MNRISRAKEVGKTVGIAIGAFLSKTVLVELQKASLDQVTVTLVVIAIVVTSAKSLEILIGEALERWIWLRRLVCGKLYIEGNWIDFADCEGGLYGIISIQFIDGSIAVHGDALTEEASLVYSWDSVLSRYDGMTLEYLYRTTDLKKSPYLERFGYLKESFERQTATESPTSFTGTFIDFGGGDNITSNTRGARITASEAAKARKDREFLRQLASDKLGVTERRSHQTAPPG